MTARVAHTMHNSPQSRLSVADRNALGALATAGIEVRFDEPMSRRTTLRIGGPADALVLPDSIPGLRAAVEVCVERQIPITVVGGGSNLLVRDGGVRGVVLATRRIRGIETLSPSASASLLQPPSQPDPGQLPPTEAVHADAGQAPSATVLRVECGLSTGKLLSLATKWQLGGLEFLGGVPGSVGGGIRMNAGTYLGEFKDVTIQVTTVRLGDAQLIVRSGAECGFVYRDSAIGKDEIVAQAHLALRGRARAAIEADVAGLRKRRHEREPKGVSNAGSTFKNPPGDYAGRLIEACGLKGTRVGGAECSPAHANWLVNAGGATAADVLALVDLVRARVSEVHGIVLEMELKVIGED